MLTKQQVKEFELLIPTIKESRYKEFVSRAVDNWKITAYPPKKGLYGISLVREDSIKEYKNRTPGVLCKESFIFIENKNTKGCCLIGSYLIGMFNELVLTPEEEEIVIIHFDTTCFCSNEHILFELVKLVRKIRKIALEC